MTLRTVIADGSTQNVSSLCRRERGIKDDGRVRRLATTKESVIRCEMYAPSYLDKSHAQRCKDKQHKAKPLSHLHLGHVAIIDKKQSLLFQHRPG